MTADPVFALIKRHRQAEATAHAAEPCAKELMNQFVDEARRAYAALLAFTPTTAAGATAALVHVVQHENELAPWADNWGEIFTAAGHDFIFRIAAVLRKEA